MIQITPVLPGMLEGKCEIPLQPAHEVFQRLYREYPLHFLLESKEVSLFSGRFSLIGIDPVLKITGKDDSFEVSLLHDRGRLYFDQLHFPYAEAYEKTGQTIRGKVIGEKSTLEESQRSKRRNIAQVIRTVLETFSTPEKTFLGLYGAFSYDFIRLFEDLGDRLPKNELNDFSLFLYDTFILFDHIKEKNFILVYRDRESSLQEAIDQLLLLPPNHPPHTGFHISDPKYSLSQEAFEDLVRIAKGYIRDGEFVQVVFSNILKTQFSGDPFSLYLTYRDKNPSPYLFYYDFGDEQLVGASPEMMVRCEDGVVHLRPIAGTAKRGVDPIDDHDHLVDLLKSPKERAELDMLIDLGRSDLSRICEPGITLDDYRFVEKYSRVMHTVAHLSGKLRKDFTGLDALISCLNAGTLTGAPKIAAMRTIEKHEKERRGYYGGAVGQLTFSGDVDTAIIIRTAHIRDHELRYQTGAGIVYDSEPALEYRESMNKAQAFLETFVQSSEFRVDSRESISKVV